MTADCINLSFGLSSSYSEEFAQKILGFSSEANGQRPFASSKSTRGASKVPEDEGEKSKTQVISYFVPRSSCWISAGPLILTRLTTFEIKIL